MWTNRSAQHFPHHEHRETANTCRRFLPSRPKSSTLPGRIHRDRRAGKEQTPKAGAALPSFMAAAASVGEKFGEKFPSSVSALCKRGEHAQTARARRPRSTGSKQEPHGEGERRARVCACEIARLIDVVRLFHCMI